MIFPLNGDITAPATDACSSMPITTLMVQSAADLLRVGLLDERFELTQ